MLGYEARPLLRSLVLAMADLATNQPDALEKAVGLLPAALVYLGDSDIVADRTLTPAAELMADEEGWGLFWNDAAQRVEVQRLDGSPVMFVSDEAAVEHVQRRAEAGSRLHRLALEIHEEERSRSRRPKVNTPTG